MVSEQGKRIIWGCGKNKTRWGCVQQRLPARACDDRGIWRITEGEPPVRIYVGFDDTDTTDADRGTGKLARWFDEALPEGCRLWGVVRQQLLVHEAIPYTSHNSSACAVVEAAGPEVVPILVTRAADHIERLSFPGSDPGLCVACEGDAVLAALGEFGRRAATEVVTQVDARTAAGAVHLSGHGGSEDGIIGAAAAVGLTAGGWSGRMIEYRGCLRSFPHSVAVSDLESSGIRVASIDRDAPLPAPRDCVDTQGWLRPRLWGGAAVLPVTRIGPSLWRSLGSKRRKGTKPGGSED
jgi:hypothetical protein